MRLARLKLSEKVSIKFMQTSGKREVENLIKCPLNTNMVEDVENLHPTSCDASLLSHAATTVEKVEDVQVNLRTGWPT